MERREREALDRYITGNYGEDQFKNAKVTAIKVGGEWHNVEDVDGEWLDEVTVSEQCDSCGSTRPDGTQAPFALVTLAPHDTAIYECSYCGWQPDMDLRHEDEVVF